MPNAPKKRGRPRKLLAFVVALGEDREKWESYLKSVGLPQEKYSIDFQQDAIPPAQRDARGRRTGPKKEVFGETWGHESVTHNDDALGTLREESATNEAITLTPEWAEYLGYIGVIAEALSPADNGKVWKELALRDARSRHWESPPEMLQQMSASFGSPIQFRERWLYGELEIRAHARNRREHVIEIWRLPPQEPEDLEEEGPVGHWEGLKWISDKE